MSLDFLVAGGWKLAADSFTGQVASQRVQVERGCKPLLAAHPTVEFDLQLEGSFWTHTAKTLCVFRPLFEVCHRRKPLQEKALTPGTTETGRSQRERGPERKTPGGRSLGVGR